MPQNSNSNGYDQINQNYWQGGQTIDPKLGIANSFYSSVALDFRSLPSQISVLPGMQTISGNMNDLLTAMEQDLNGVRWGVGVNGGLWKVNTSNVVSKEAQLTTAGTAGLLYNQLTDQLYIPGTTKVSMYGQVTSGIASNPIWRPDVFAESASTAPGCVNLYNPSDGFFDGDARNNAQSIGTGITEAVVSSGQVITNATHTYSVPIGISEAATNYCFFAPDIEPFYSIQVYINTKGTGNWTLTLHDSLNNKLASTTVTNANLTSRAYNEFKFSSPIRAIVNASQTGGSSTYHFHLTSTVADGLAGTLVQDDLSSVDFLLFANRLIATQNGWHPTAFFIGGGVPLMCVGNGHYLSTYNFGNDSNPTNQQWERHKLQFEYGYEVCGMTTNNQYLIIAVEKRSKSATRNFQNGILYFWDGTTNAPTMKIDIPMGAPYGLYTFNNVTYFACAGSLFAWSGGQTVIKVRKLAYQNTDYLNAADSTIVNPNMFTSRYNLMMMGYPSSSTNPNINYGVWSWGSVELTFPNSYGLSYLLANQITNNTSPISNLQIGCVYNFVDSMYVSWSYTDTNDVTHYGLDLLDNFSTTAPTFQWQSLIYDGGAAYKTKQAGRLKLTHLPLPAGCTLQVGYSLDRGAWVWGNSAAVGDNAVVIDINNRFREIQYGFKGTTSGGSNPPTILGTTIDINPLPLEQALIKEI